MLLTSGVPWPVPGGGPTPAATAGLYPGPDGDESKVMDPGPVTPICAHPFVFLYARLSSGIPPVVAPVGRSDTVIVISVKPTYSVNVFEFSTGGMNGRFLITRPNGLKTTGCDEVARGTVLLGDGSGPFGGLLFSLPRNRFVYSVYVLSFFSYEGDVGVATCTVPTVPGR